MTILGASVGAGRELYKKVAEGRKEKKQQKAEQDKSRQEELREVCLDMLASNYAIDLQNREEIIERLNSIRDINQLEEISDLIGKLTNNLIILRDVLNSTDQKNADREIKNALEELDENGFNIILTIKLLDE